MAPSGVQTRSPSTTLSADRLRKTLESPFSFPSPPPDAGPAGAASRGLSDRHLREIETVFRIFDPSLSGGVDVPTFEAMARSLGFRLTRPEIRGTAEGIREDRRKRPGRAADSSVAAERGETIDLPMAIEILARRGYANRDREDEMRMYFRIFDGGNKGHITPEDLRRVQGEVIDAEREMSIGSARNGMDASALGEATLLEMVKQFDSNCDGVVDYEEFKNILEPVLSTSPPSSS